MAFIFGPKDRPAGFATREPHSRRRDIRSLTLECAVGCSGTPVRFATGRAGVPFGYRCPGLHAITARHVTTCDCPLIQSLAATSSMTPWIHNTSLESNSARARVACNDSHNCGNARGHVGCEAVCRSIARRTTRIPTRDSCWFAPIRTDAPVASFFRVRRIRLSMSC